MDDLWHSTLLSLRIALAATALAALTAIPMAYCLARKRFFGKTIIETLVILPLVLPPTVVGYLLLVVFGVRGPIGKGLYELTGWRFIFSEPAAMVAAAVVAFPLLLIPARAAFANIDRDLLEVAHLMGASRPMIFLRVSLPMAKAGIAGGLLLAFARALGELGATIMVFGNIEGRRTLPIGVYYSVVETGDLSAALPAVLVLAGASVAITFIFWRTHLGRPS
jgi:molybdate transport system permease protein